MLKFNNFLDEQKENHAVLAFGRMNPPTTGHEVLINKVKETTKHYKAKNFVVLSHSQDKKKNPLTQDQKLKYAKIFFPGINILAASKEEPSFLYFAAKINKMGFTHLHVIAGSDRVEEYKTKLQKYNGTDKNSLFNFKSIMVHSAGERDPDAEGTTGMSASKMRHFAQMNNFNEFRKGVPSHVSEKNAKDLFQDVRKAMHLNESVDINEEFDNFISEGVHDTSIFKAVFLSGGPGSGKDYVLSNTLSGHGLTEINSDKALEFLMDKEGLDKKMPDSEEKQRDIVRKKAKNMTELRQRLALHGRNGLIINGTGDDPEKVNKIKSMLEKLGYESSMLLVNTDDEVSKQRNIDRGRTGGRTVPEKIRKEKWDNVQAARPEYAKMFGDSYMEFDNSNDLRTADPEIVQSKKEEMLGLFNKVREFTKAPPKNDSAQNWIAQELTKKDTLPIPKDGTEMVPHSESDAAEEARKLGLKYYGFGRYGTDGKVTHRSVHDKLVQITKMNESIDDQFEEFINEDLRKWFSKTDPEGGWKRINSKGEAIGPCAREPGEPKPKCMSNEKRASLSKKERASAVKAKRKHDPNPERKGAPINVSNFGKGKLSESFDLSDSSSLNLLLLGNKIDEIDYQHFDEENRVGLMKDGNGRVRMFMLRSAAAKEAHTNNGTVLPYKNGYVVKVKKENTNEDFRIFIESIQEGITQGRTSDTSSGSTGSSRGSEGGRAKSGTDRQLWESTTNNRSITSSGYEKEASPKQEGEQAKRKITLAEIRRKKESKVQESIDKGIEPGVSMSGSGESIGRDTGEKIRKKTGKSSQVAEMQGDETTASISAQKEDELKKKGISLSSFKSKNVI
jgi:hypothetical protein